MPVFPPVLRRRPAESSFSEAVCTVAEPKPDSISARMAQDTAKREGTTIRRMRLPGNGTAFRLCVAIAGRRDGRQVRHPKATNESAVATCKAELVGTSLRSATTPDTQRAILCTRGGVFPEPTHRALLVHYSALSWYGYNEPIVEDCGRALQSIAGDVIAERIMNVLVTGGTGFVGASIVRQLASDGHQVWSLSRQIGGLEPAVQRYWAPFRARITDIAGDITDPKSVNDVFRNCRPSHVVHAAATTSVHDVSAVRRILRVNLSGTINILEAADAHSVSRVLYVSSGAVYGPAAEEDAIHEHAPLRGNGAYARTKIAGEKLCNLYRHELNRFDTVIVRLGWTYGPMERQMPGSRESMSLVHQVVGLALSGREVRLADLDHVRDWTCVDDVARALSLLLTRSGLRHHVYNLSGGVGISHRQLLHTLARVVPVSFREVRDTDTNVPPSATQGQRGPLSTERLVQDAGFKTSTDLEEGLRHYVHWVQMDARAREREDASAEAGLL